MGEVGAASFGFGLDDCGGLGGMARAAHQVLPPAWSDRLRSPAQVDGLSVDCVAGWYLR